MNRFLLLLIIVLAATPCLAADVTLYDQVEPTPGVIRLGDVAKIDNAPPEEVARLGKLPLMPTPAVGTQTFITAQGIRDLIVATGEDLNALRFLGATKIAIGRSPRTVVQEPALTSPPRTFVAESAPQVRPVQRNARLAQQSGFRRSPVHASLAPRTSGSLARRVSPLSPYRVAELKKSLQEQLSSFAQKESGREMLHVLDPEVETRHLQWLAMADGEVNITATTTIGEGRQRFLVSFTTAKGDVRFPVFAELKPAQPAVFVKRSIARGSVITAADVERKPLPLDAKLAADEVPAITIEEVVGKETGRSLRAGTVLTDVNCLPPTLVRRGDVVSVLAGGDGIRIQMQAKARANGRLGESIEVETIDHRERLVARVVGRRELAILSAAVGAADYVADAATRSLR